MSKHTLGPWTYEPYKFISGARIIGDYSFIGKIDDINDARLIAAAPDMLAELERLLDVLGDEDCAIVEALIAKAKGE